MWSNNTWIVIANWHYKCFRVCRLLVSRTIPGVAFEEILFFIRNIRKSIFNSNLGYTSNVLFATKTLLRISFLKNNNYK